MEGPYDPETCLLETSSQYRAPTPPPCNPPLREPTLISFRISKDTLKRDFHKYPEFVEEINKLTFKRYLAFADVSPATSRVAWWKVDVPEYRLRTEDVNLSLIGTRRPLPEFFPECVRELYAAEAGTLCRPIHLHPPTKDDDGERGYDLHGPALEHLTLPTAYLYTTHRYQVSIPTLTHRNPQAQADAEPQSLTSASLTKRKWKILYDGDSLNFDDKFLDAEFKIRELWTEYGKDHPQETAKPCMHIDRFFEGLGDRIPFPDYYLPIDASLDIDVDEKEVEDPCGFQRELDSIQSAFSKLPNDPKEDTTPPTNTSPTEPIATDSNSIPPVDSQHANSIPPTADSNQPSSLTDSPQVLPTNLPQPPTPSPPPRSRARPTRSRASLPPKRSSTRVKDSDTTSLRFGLTAGFVLVGLSAAAGVAFSYMSRRALVR
ncbi:hypothetical protein FRB90_002888 [Tulasnella sp. 427]|nr:hypothetical protein FRB90_002888 [Tulasnella sp. 427]